MDKLRVAAYCRVSTDKHDQANSFSSQVRYFSEYIQEQPLWEQAGIYADEGISGTSTKKRAQFNKMISDAENGLLDLILTKEVSRFARNTVDTLAYTRRLKKAGVGVLFVNDNIDTRDTDGELRLSIMATIAQDESRKTSERVKWGQRRRMEQGVVFGRDMLGYTVKGGRLYLNEDQAETVRLIFHKYVNEGKGTHVIAREMGESGIRPMRAKGWSNTAILRVLKNEKYVGDLLLKKTYTPDYLDHVKKVNRGQEDIIYLKNHHSDIAIIDRETWDRAQTELRLRALSDGQKRKYSNRYWCSGKLTCGQCGGQCVSRTKPLKNGTVYYAWRCYKSSNHGTPKTDVFGDLLGCGGTSIGDRTIRALVGHSIDYILVDKNRIAKDLMGHIIMPRESRTDSIALIERQIESIRVKKITIIDMAAGGAISKKDLCEQNDYYDQELVRLNCRIRELLKETATQREQVTSFNKYSDRIETILTSKSENDTFLSEMLDRAIIYSGKKVKVFLKGVSFGLVLCFSTFGRMRSFTVSVDSVSLADD